MTITPQICLASDYRLLEVDKLDFEYHRLAAANRDPYVPHHTGTWREKAAIKWDLGILKYGYWRNNVHTETTNPSGRVTTVGWEWELGVTLFKNYEIFHHHHSRHVMEEVPEKRFESGNQFPNENSYGIRFKLYEKKGK